jgi:iron complex outermembrane recepter protein
MKIIILTILVCLVFCNLSAQVEKIEPPVISDSVQLEEVVISETVPINNKQVENFYKTNTAATIDNVLARLDGVSMIRRGAYAMEPSLNGFSGGQLNITIDGMKMFGACTDKMDPITSYVEPSNLKSIKVQHGSSGCKCGSNTGGSVDMCLNEPCKTSPNPFNISTSLGYESVSNGKIALLSTGYVKNKWQWGLNGSYRKSDSYTDGYGDVVPFTQYEKTNFNTVLKFLPDSNNSFKADFLYDLALDVGYAALPMDVSKARAYLAALEYEHHNRIDLQAKIYFNSILHIMDDSQRDSLYYVTNYNTGEQEEVYMRMDMPGYSSTLGAFAQAGINLNSKNHLTLKVDNYTNHSLAEMTMYMHYPGEPPEAPMYLQTWPDMIRTVTGIYLRNSTYFTPELVLTVEGRMDYCADILQSSLAKEQFSVFGFELADKKFQFTKTLNTSLLYSISKPVTINLDAGYSERLPTITEWYGFYLYNAHDGYDYIGNPDLDPEKSWFGSVGLQFSRPWLKVNLSQSVNLVRDYILGVTDTVIPSMNFYTNGTKVFQNISGATLLNSSLQAQLIPVHGLSVFLLTKYTWGELNTGEPIPMIPPLNNVLSVSYQFGNWGFQAENETALAQNRINVNYGEIISEPYTLFNIKGSYRLMILKPVTVDISLAISNLFNAKYYTHLDWGQIYRPGRSIDVFLKFSF